MTTTDPIARLATTINEMGYDFEMIGAGGNLAEIILPVDHWKNTLRSIFTAARVDYTEVDVSIDTDVDDDFVLVKIEA